MSEIKKTKAAISGVKAELTESSFTLNTARDKYTEVQKSITAAANIVEQLGVATVALTQNSENTTKANKAAMQHLEDAVVGLVSLGLGTVGSENGQYLLATATDSFERTQFAQADLESIKETTDKCSPSDIQTMRDALLFALPWIATRIEETVSTQQNALTSIEAATQIIQDL